MHKPGEAEKKIFWDNLNGVNGFQVKSHIIDSVEKYHYRFSTRLAACKKEFTEGGVHDLRVSIRKFDEAIKLASAFSSSEYIKIVRKELKSVFKLLGDLRDIQVLILSLQKMRIDYPEANDFYYEVLAQELTQIKNVENYFRKSKKNFLKQEMFFIMLDLKINVNQNEIKGAMLYDMLQKAYLKVEQNLKSANADDIKSIHAIRISFKKFRYLFDLVRPLTNLQKTSLSSLQTYQDYLGMVQDASVMNVKLHDYISKQSNPMQELLNNLQLLASQRLKNAVDLYAANSEELKNFDFFSKEDQSESSVSLSSPIKLIEGASGKN